MNEAQLTELLSKLSAAQLIKLGNVAKGVSRRATAMKAKGQRFAGTMLVPAGKAHVCASFDGIKIVFSSLPLSQAFSLAREAESMRAYVRIFTVETVEKNGLTAPVLELLDNGEYRPRYYWVRSNGIKLSELKTVKEWDAWASIPKTNLNDYGSLTCLFDSLGIPVDTSTWNKPVVKKSRRVSPALAPSIPVELSPVGRGGEIATETWYTSFLLDPDHEIRIENLPTPFQGKPQVEITYYTFSYKTMMDLVAAGEKLGFSFETKLRNKGGMNSKFRAIWTQPKGF